MTTPVQKVTLDLKTAAAMVIVIISGVVSTIAGIHKMSSDLRSDMMSLEARWVERVVEVESRIRQELRELERRLPPPHVTQRFEFLEHRLDQIETKIGMPKNGN